MTKDEQIHKIIFYIGIIILWGCRENSARATDPEKIITTALFKYNKYIL